MQHQPHDLRYSKQLIHCQSPAVFSSLQKNSAKAQKMQRKLNKTERKEGKKQNLTVVFWGA